MLQALTPALSQWERERRCCAARHSMLAARRSPLASRFSLLASRFSHDGNPRLAASAQGSSSNTSVYDARNVVAA